MDRVKYNTLIPESIYIGSETDAQDMVDVAGCRYIIDLREGVQKPAFSGEGTEWIHIGLNDHLEGQEEKIQRAVDIISDLYYKGNKIGIHCESGICRTAAISIGILMKLRFCRKLKEALEYVQITRRQTSIHPSLMLSLQKLYHR